MVRLKLAVGALVLAACALSACAWMDHRTDSSLQRELIERSKQGLALMMFPGNTPDVVVAFFDGKFTTLHPNCCAPVWYATAWRNRIVMVDVPSVPTVPDTIRDPAGASAAFAEYWGPLIEMDTAGRMVARSVARFRPAPLSLAPDGERFAIMSPPQGREDLPPGLYVGGFHENTARGLVTTNQARYYGSFADQPSSDWSPRGDVLLFSHLGTVSLIDVDTGISRKLVDGGAAAWSPLGDWISYVTPKSEVALLNPSTGGSKMIDPGRKMHFAPKWSPDGKYLLIPEGDGGYVVGGCLWVYRVSDGAWVPLTHLGTFRTEWLWIQMQQSKTHG